METWMFLLMMKMMLPFDPDSQGLVDDVNVMSMTGVYVSLSVYLLGVLTARSDEVAAKLWIGVGLLFTCTN